MDQNIFHKVYWVLYMLSWCLSIIKKVKRSHATMCLIWFFAMHVPNICVHTPTYTKYTLYVYRNPLWDMTTRLLTSRP